jgi:hypothetical protein
MVPSAAHSSGGRSPPEHRRSMGRFARPAHDRAALSPRERRLSAGVDVDNPTVAKTSQIGFKTAQIFGCLAAKFETGEAK